MAVTANDHDRDITKDVTKRAVVALLFTCRQFLREVTPQCKTILDKEVAGVQSRITILELMASSERAHEALPLIEAHPDPDFTEYCRVYMGSVTATNAMWQKLYNVYLDSKDLLWIMNQDEDLALPWLEDLEQRMFPERYYWVWRFLR
jgi:hypothetical protein